MRSVKLSRPVLMRVTIAGLWLVALAAAVVIAGPDNVASYYAQITPQNIRDQVSAFGVLTGIAFLVASLIRPLFFLPVTPFTIASGYLFGFWQGVAWSFAGTTLSATLTFLISRYLFHDFVTRRFSGRLEHINRALDDSGWSYVMFVRVIPLVPFDLVGFAAGASSVRFRDYLIGTILGEMPGAIVLVMFGASLDQIGSATFYASLGLAAIVLLGPIAVRRWMKKRKEELAKDTTDTTGTM
jgi:uncharacterized membrane protein YdjX (TVP38/TMEM64 family)